jgi:hypothetical protein
MRVLAGAILSANAYNTQPWLFRVGVDWIDLLANSERNMANLDPLRREMYMSLGCALENACIASPSQGLKPVVSLFPEATDSTLVARIEFRPTAREIHPHYNAIALRHTNRNPYRTDRKIEAVVVDALMDLADRPDVKLILTDAKSAEGASFIERTAESTRFILENTSLREGRHKGLRLASNDSGGLTDAALEKADQSWLEATQTIACGTAAAFGLVMVRGERSDHRLHVEAGRLWQRVHLDGAARGVAMQPMNHQIEVIDHQIASGGASALKAKMNLGSAWEGWEPIFGFRAGYSDKGAPASSRRPLSSVIVT